MWLDVPFVKQEKSLCGAACISMVLQYWDVKLETSPASSTRQAAEIGKALYSKEARGILGSDMERYFRKQRFDAFIFEGQWTDLEHHLSKGRPLLVCLKPAGSSLHYVVVVGLDSEQGQVLINDPAQRKLLRWERSEFEKAWNLAHRWTLLAVPQTLPAKGLGSADAR